MVNSDRYWRAIRREEERLRSKKRNKEQEEKKWREVEKYWENKTSNGKSFVCGSFGHIVRVRKKRRMQYSSFQIG